MSSGDAVFRRIQSLARSTAAKSGIGAPTQEYLARHALESFLDRLARTSHSRNFVLKGGILLAAYGVRRPTKDVDANAVSIDVTAEHLADVVQAIAAIDVDDGAVFDLDTISVQQIREQTDYPGLRLRVAVSIGPWTGAASRDVSTGDPIVPPPRQVTINRILGDPGLARRLHSTSSIARDGAVSTTRSAGRIESAMCSGGSLYLRGNRHALHDAESTLHLQVHSWPCDAQAAHGRRPGVI